jgi:2-dehydro-3-deoxyphosphogluconate aldolase/(4S)-4-hydroxy-2-oxoglutarate aldolase
MSREHALDTIIVQRVIAIVRESSGQAALGVCSQLVQSGIRAIEVSLVTPDALGVIAQLRATADASVAVGVGTALTVGDVRDAAAAGASFVISPVYDAEVIRATLAADMASIPAAATPTEAMVASQLGADLVKIFPASLWNPSALQDVLRALPRLRCVPTGGVGLATGAAWIAAGAAAVGIGSALSRSAAQGLDHEIEGLLQALAGADGHR